jgi:RHS repeat-associated protein
MRDNVSDLQWNINRWYDANVGRWCSEDPIGFNGGDNNLVRYVNNNPCFFSDQHGKNKEVFVSAFNNAVIAATQHSVSNGPNQPTHFADVFNIRPFLLKLSDNLVGGTYTFNMVPAVTGGASARYYPYSNTFEFQSNIAPATAVHEAAHAYNDKKLGIWSADYDEALAYLLEQLVNYYFMNSFKEWELKLNGACPVGDDESMKSFMRFWNYQIWELTIMTGLSSTSITYSGDPVGRTATETDFSNLKKDYGIHISCSKYMEWSLSTIEKNWGNSCNTKCIKLKCPDTLWDIFK